MPLLPSPPTDRVELVAWVTEHLGHLACDEVRPSSIRGGQLAADAALTGVQVGGLGSSGTSRASPSPGPCDHPTGPS